jgi:hypothetical protein
MLTAKRLWLLPIAAAPLVLSAPAIAQPLPNWCHQAKTSWPGGCAGPAHKIDKEKEAKSAKVQGGTSKTINPKQVPAGAVQVKDGALAKKPSVLVDPTNPNTPGDKRLKAGQGTGAHDLGSSGVCFPPSKCGELQTMQNPGGAPGLRDPVPHLNPDAGRLK